MMRPIVEIGSFRHLLHQGTGIPFCTAWIAQRSTGKMDDAAV